MRQQECDWKSKQGTKPSFFLSGNKKDSDSSDGTIQTNISSPSKQIYGSVSVSGGESSPWYIKSGTWCLFCREAGVDQRRPRSGCGLSGDDGPSKIPKTKKETQPRLFWYKTHLGICFRIRQKFQTPVVTTKDTANTEQP